ncbi:MAG: hypothetical protein AABZ10_10585 [Nitrospirota bacterium]
MNDNPKYVRPEWLQALDPKFDTLSFHIQHPEISPDVYIRSQHIALGQQVLAKRRIYLDQKYWIYCRDVVRGRPQHPLHSEIYKVLGQAVKSGTAICPASHLILEETLKQEDPESRHLTATIVQELSTGVSLQAFPVLSQAEILHFLITTRPWPVDAFPCEQMAWTYIGNVFGHISPVSTAFDADTENAIRKAWFDSMGGIQFPVLAERLFPLPFEIARSHSGRYDEQNEQCRKHEKDFSSFPEVFLIEISDALDVYKDELAEAQKYLFQKYIGQKDVIVPDDQLAEGTRQLSNLIYHAFRLGKITDQLPGLRIMAGIHAAMRYKHQKHRKGDRHDHLHARVALPYCNLFLTERTLGHILCDKPLEYDKLYGCRVAWEPGDALGALNDVLQQTQ